MDSLKDLISQIKNKSKQDVDTDTNQSKLFDTSKLETNPNKMFGDKHKYISKEYQLYGLRLSNKLNDKERATMYIKWAKEKPRGLLEQALSFTMDYPDAQDKSRIFMWKVKELEKEYEVKKESDNDKEKKEEKTNKKSSKKKKTTRKLPL
jgi:leucyl aminopeptidase